MIRIGILGLRLDPTGTAVRSMQITDDTVIAAYDPTRVTRDIATAWLHVNYGDYVEVDGSQAIAEHIGGCP
ncbi:hypothetical protein [Kitasatospora sp. NBC_01302]|uniref:hypothetical protein n=1 Tax=Kitasatospora sp. NBC_01302 TaxID=2903575 RepID=UPI002E0F0DB4|nr:hypothetical protein OG294_27695 [Kitasatospora sp. NBC_01302]